MQNPIKPLVISYIRWSLGRQSLGGSLSRQAGMAKEYAEKNGLTIDNTIVDDGFSGRTAQHISHGQLGKFLEACKTGKIPHGSTLLLDSLDRLSRQQVTTALKQFLQIIEDYKITIVSLSDGMRYEPGHIDMQQLIISIVGMCRAFEESEMKSKRHLINYANKKADMHKGIISTTRVPAWLKVIGREKQGSRMVGGKFEIIPERIALIERMFALYLDGYGIPSIARKLTKEKLCTFTGREKAWDVSYISKIIRDKRLLGYAQPWSTITVIGRKTKKQVPDGDPIPNYYPAVIDKKTFFLAQTIINSRARLKTDFKDKASNLFVKLAFCSHCNEPMILQIKWYNNKFYSYYYCKKALYGECKVHSKGFNYMAYEKMILQVIADELCLTDFANGKKEHCEMDHLLQLQQADKAEIEDLRKQIDGWDNYIAGTTVERMENTRARLEPKITNAENKIKVLQDKLTETDNRIATYSTHSDDISKQLESIRGILAFIDKAAIRDEAVIELRIKLRAKIAFLISRIEINPLTRTSIISLNGTNIQKVMLMKGDGIDDYIGKALKGAIKGKPKELEIEFSRNSSIPESVGQLITLTPAAA